MRRPALAAAAVLEPRRRHIAEGIRVDGPEEGLVGRVGYGVGIAAQVCLQGVRHRLVDDDVAAGLGAIANQAGGVGQEESHAADDGLR